MATDANVTVQASVTKTATFQSTALDLKNGTPTRGLVMRVIYSAAANASGSNVVTFSVEHSDDNSTFYTEASAAADALTLSTTAQAGEQFIPFRTRKRYVRLVQTMTGSGTSPTITYQGDLMTALP